MKKIVLLLTLVSIFVSCKEQPKNNSEINKKKSNTYVITGTNWGEFEGYTIQIKIKDTVENILVSDVIKNGTFEFRGTIEDPRIGFFSLQDQEGKEQLVRDRFIVEVDSVNLEFVDQEMPVKFSGGLYNKNILNRVNYSDAYLSNLKEYYKFSSSITNYEELYKDTLRLKRFIKIGDELGKARKDGFKQIFNATKDPYEKLLVMGSQKNITDNPLKVLDSLEKVFDKTVLELVAQRNKIKEATKMKENQATMAIGATIKGFAAKNLRGKNVRLANILKENEYVLVEFWASWCGPCRKEVPNMKMAYKEYKNKGFEIFAFSIDEKKDEWERAVEEDAVPWINVSDLLARTSPIVQMYGVTSIPRNYLVDKNGIIVAKNLRKDRLAKKLEELLGK